MTQVAVEFQKWETEKIPTYKSEKFKMTEIKQKYSNVVHLFFCNLSSKKNGKPQKIFVLETPETE